MPLYNFIDAQYPDILGYSIIAPFYFLSLAHALKERKFWLLLPPIILFLAILLAHHQTAILVLGISILSLLGYSIFLLIGKVNNLFPLKTLIIYIVLSGGFLLIGRLFYAETLKSGLNSLLYQQPITFSIWSSVQEYQDITQLLTPFLEFIGLAGLLLVIKRFGRATARYSDILLIVWVMFLWILSRFDFIGLPSRILREISLPLSILAGFFINQILTNLESIWQRYLMIFLVSYAIIINIVQINVPPFLIPPGFSHVSWYTKEDNQKLDFFTKNIPTGSKVIANYSNPVLNYKLERAGYRLVLFNQSYDQLLTSEQKKRELLNYIESSGADYLFIGSKPEFSPEDIYFTQFSNYTPATKVLNLYPYSDQRLVKNFLDGSKLIALKSDIGSD